MEHDKMDKPVTSNEGSIEPALGIAQMRQRMAAAQRAGDTDAQKRFRPLPTEDSEAFRGGPQTKWNRD